MSPSLVVLPQKLQRLPSVREEPQYSWSEAVLPQHPVGCSVVKVVQRSRWRRCLAAVSGNPATLTLDYLNDLDASFNAEQNASQCTYA